MSSLPNLNIQYVRSPNIPPYMCCVSPPHFHPFTHIHHIWSVVVLGKHDSQMTPFFLLLMTFGAHWSSWTCLFCCYSSYCLTSLTLCHMYFNRTLCVHVCARASAWLTGTGSQKFQRMHLFFSFFLSFNNNGLTSCDPGNGLLPRPLLLCDSATQAARSQGHFQRTFKYILVAVPGRKASLFVVTGWLNVFTILTLNCLNLLGGK